jgi:TolA-binding protein
LQSGLAAVQAGLATTSNQITALTNQLTNINGQITTLQSNVSSQISSMQTQLSTITTQLTALQNNVTSLSAEVSVITTTNPLFTSQGISQSFGTQTQVYTFTPSYTGEIYLSGTSSSSTGYIRVINNSTSATNTYTFGTGTVITVGLIGGDNYTIYFGNSDTTGTIIATLSASYYM